MFSAKDGFMTSYHETSRAAYELSLQGHSLEYIAERLQTNDDRSLSTSVSYLPVQPRPSGMVCRVAPESCLNDALHVETSAAERFGANAAGRSCCEWRHAPSRVIMNGSLAR